MGKIDWSEKREVPERSGKGGINFFSFKDGTVLNCRPIGDAQVFWVIWPTGKNKVIVSKDDKDEAAQMVSEQLGKPITPQERFAINIIDREDGHVKVMEQGQTVLNAFWDWAEMEGCSPGHTKKGVDWRIRAKGNGQSRKYQCTAGSRSTVISDEDKKKIKESGEFTALDEYYVESPLDEVLNKVFGTGFSGGQTDDDVDTDSDDDKEW